MNLRIVRWVDRYVGIPLACVLFCLWRLVGLKRQGGSAAEGAFRKILLVKFWGVGNIAMLLAAAQDLKARYPLADLDLLTLDLNTGVADLARVFDRIHTVRIDSFASFISSSIVTLVKTKAAGYDLVIDFEQFARFSALWCAFTGARVTSGFSTPGQYRHFLYARNIPYDNSIHTVHLFRKIAGVGAPPLRPVRYPLLFPRPSDKRKVSALLRERGIVPSDILVVLHPGTSSNFTLRRWPPDCFSVLADRLVNSFKVKVVFSGLEEEKPLAKKALQLMQRKDHAFDLSGRLDFGEFLALLETSDLVVSADTSPVHLCSCLDKPAAGIFGPNTPFLYGPWGNRQVFFYKPPACSPCITNYNSKINTCRHPDGEGACMKAISAEEVFEGLSKDFFAPDARFRLAKLPAEEEALL